VTGPERDLPGSSSSKNGVISMRYKCRQKMVSRPSLKEACDLPKAQGAVVMKHDDVNGSAAASNLELYPQKHGSSCCIHKDTMLLQPAFPCGISTRILAMAEHQHNRILFQNPLCFSRDGHPRLLMSAVIRNCLNL